MDSKTILKKTRNAISAKVNIFLPATYVSTKVKNLKVSSTVSLRSQIQIVIKEGRSPTMRSHLRKYLTTFGHHVTGSSHNT